VGYGEWSWAVRSDVITLTLIPAGVLAPDASLPAAAAVGAAAAWLASTGAVGTIIVAPVAVALAGGIYAASRRRPVTAENVNDVPAPTASAHAAA
jgi:hypothetical protein